MKKTIQLLSILIFVCLGMLIFLHKSTIISSPNEEDAIFTINFLDIGQGDATLITFEDGQQMLVDCAIDARIIEALGRAMPVYDKDIDYLVVTHPDADHYGGCIDVLNQFNIGTIIVNGLEKNGDFFQTYWDTVEAEESELLFLSRETVWSIASTTIHWLYPDHDIQIDSDIPGIEKETNANDTSIAMKLSYNGVDILMTGDAEEAEELYLIDTYGAQLDIDILKAGHHGSNTSSIPPFVEATSPLHSIFSAGVDNNFGHPSLRVIRRLERAGSKIWRTDRQGDILLEVGEGEFWLNKEHFYVE